MSKSNEKRATLCQLKLGSWKRQKAIRICLCMISFAITSIGTVDGATVGGGLSVRVVGGRVSARWVVLGNVAKMKKRNPSAIDTHQVISLETRGW